MTETVEEEIQILPAIPKPPDDPRHLLLDPQAGWRAFSLSGVEQSSNDGWLQLAPKAESGHPLADVAGTFGGLDLPTGVTMAGGVIYLADVATGKIKRFDPCACGFEEVPCTGGPGSAPRQFKSPHGIAIYCGDLFVCDTGNHRVQVFALKGMTLRAIWPTPSAAEFAQPWQPHDIGFDARGRAFVTDEANGVVHCFDRRGHWQRSFGALSQPTHLAIDREGRVYVAQGGSSTATIFDGDGKQLGTESRAAKLAPSFRAPGIATDRGGNLYLGDRCVPPADPPQAVFDRHGNKLTLTSKQLQALQFPAAAFEQEGTYLSLPLDSGIYRCQWHRVVLCGDIPSGAHVKVETFTAETPLDSIDLSNVPETEWRTRQKTAAMTKGSWDCLIISPPGRFLYLRLTLWGNGAVTPRLSRIRLFFPRISLRRYLPAVFGENPVSADFTDRLLAVFDTIFRSVEEKVDQFALHLDPLAAPVERDPQTQNNFLTWLASWMGLALEQGWDLRKRRRLLAEAHILFRLRGTVEGLRRHLLIYLGWKARDWCGHVPVPRCPVPDPCAPCQSREWAPPALLLEHFKLRRWLFVGEGRLGDQAVLWGERIVNRTQLDRTAQVGRTQLIATGDPVRDPFHVYAHKFSVFIPAVCAADDTQRAMLERLIGMSKPAHTAHQLELLKPRFRIGFQSSIGLDAVIGRYPHGFTLEGQHERLGYDTMLSELPGQEGGPTLQVGSSSRIGTTTALD